MLPRVQPRMLRRARLLEMLDGDDAAALTLINAPVGYGKTTLLRLWCIERPEAVIWMTLDAADDDPVRLWTHLATAVERLGHGLGSQALMRLGVRGAGIEAAVDEVMNGVVAYGRPVAIVLDDLHAVGSERSLRSIAHAIERLPANARLLASTRSDPAISVARLRARGELTEIRARELAFTVDEARELLVREGIELSGESVELLVERTEGWPAGLYLAALWLRDLEDPDEGVRAFAGSTRHVADYLTDEVLTALAPRPATFCSAPRFWTGSRPSCATRSSVARTRPRCWQISRARTCSWSPSTHASSGIAITICSASFCSSSSGARTRPRCAAARRLGAESRGSSRTRSSTPPPLRTLKRSPSLLAENDRAFLWGGRLTQFLGWVRWLPFELLLEHPSLPAGGAVAAALLARPELEVQRLLAAAEQARRERPQLWSPYVEAIVEVTRAAVIERGDVGTAVEHARRAVAAARAGADVLSVGVLAALSQALFFAGELDEARRIAMQAIERPDAPDVPDGYVGSLGLLALVDAEQGRTESAEAWARQAIDFARRRFQADSWTVSLAHLGLALACTASGRLDEAEREALHGERLRRSPQPTVGHAHALLVLAHVRVARSRLERAADDLKRAQRAIAGFPDPGRLPAIAATVEREPHHRPSESRKAVTSSRNPARPSSPCCGASQPVSRDGRSASSSTSR